MKAVKPDPSVWMPLLAESALTVLPHDTILEGTLLPGLTPTSPEVQSVLARWPAAAYLHQGDGDTQVVLVYQVKDIPERFPWTHIGLLVATLITTLGAGALMAGLDPFRTRVLEIGEVGLPYPSGLDWDVLWAGAPFALPFLGVLLAHEMGHYMAARVHRVRVSLPYLIPFPPYFSVIGTLGAFIRLRGPTVQRSVLFDIGSAGPLVSFLLSIPFLAVGLALSQPVPGYADLGTPFAIRFAGQMVWLGNGALTHAMATLLGPAQVGEVLIMLHPLALVGWLGLFVTALNLLPLGQLDGGHVIYALDPERHRYAAWGFLLLLAPLGFLWWGWWGWAVLILVLHRGRISHPPVLQRGAPIGGRRAGLGLLLIVIFFLTFLPTPIAL